LVPTIAPLMPVGLVYVDVNVIARSGAKPTSVMTGAELDLAVGAASQGSGRIGLYSAGTIPAEDLAHVPSAMAAVASSFDTGEKSPWTITVPAPGGSSYGRLAVDGVRWPAGRGTAIVAGGEHRLVWSRGTPAYPSLLRFTGELGTASATP